MTPKNQRVVRVVLERNEAGDVLETTHNLDLPALLECLEYAGLVTKHRDDDKGISLRPAPAEERQRHREVGANERREDGVARLQRSVGSHLAGVIGADAGP